MKAINLKSIDDATEKDLLKYILSVQVQILRRIDFLEQKIKGTEIESPSDTIKEMMQAIDPFLNRINEYLSEDVDKGMLKL